MLKGTLNQRRYFHENRYNTKSNNPIIDNYDGKSGHENHENENEKNYDERNYDERNYDERNYDERNYENENDSENENNTFYNANNGLLEKFNNSNYN